MLCRCSGNPTAGRSQPRPCSRGDAGAMRGDAGAMLHTGTRHSPHFGTGVASPGRGEMSLGEQTRSPCSPRLFVRGRRGLGWSPSQAGRAGGAPVPQLGVEPASSAGVGAALSRRCPDSCRIPSRFGCERMSRSPAQIPGVAWHRAAG